MFFKVGKRGGRQGRGEGGRGGEAAALTPREAKRGNYWWASLLLRPSDPLPASPLVSSRIFFFFLNECQHPWWFLGCLCMLSVGVIYDILSTKAVGRGLTNARMPRSGQRWLRRPHLTLSFPIYSPPFPFMSCENQTVFLFTPTSCAHRCRCPTSRDVLSVHSQLTVPTSHGCAGPVLIKSWWLWFHLWAPLHCSGPMSKP